MARGAPLPENPQALDEMTEDPPLAPELSTVSELWRQTKGKTEKVLLLVLVAVAFAAVTVGLISLSQELSDTVPGVPWLVSGGAALVLWLLFVWFATYMRRSLQPTLALAVLLDLVYALAQPILFGALTLLAVGVAYLDLYELLTPANVLRFPYLVAAVLFVVAPVLSSKLLRDSFQDIVTRRTAANLPTGKIRGQWTWVVGVFAVLGGSWTCFFVIPRVLLAEQIDEIPLLGLLFVLVTSVTALLYAMRSQLAVLPAVVIPLATLAAAVFGLPASGSQYAPPMVASYTVPIMLSLVTAISPLLRRFGFLPSVPAIAKSVRQDMSLAANVSTTALMLAVRLWPVDSVTGQSTVTVGVAADVLIYLFVALYFQGFALMKGWSPSLPPLLILGLALLPAGSLQQLLAVGETMMVLLVVQVFVPRSVMGPSASVYLPLAWLLVERTMFVGSPYQMWFFITVVVLQTLLLFAEHYQGTPIDFVRDLMPWSFFLGAPSYKVKGTAPPSEATSAPSDDPSAPVIPGSSAAAAGEEEEEDGTTVPVYPAVQVRLAWSRALFGLVLFATPSMFLQANAAWATAFALFYVAVLFLFSAAQRVAVVHEIIVFEYFTGAVFASLLYMAYVGRLNYFDGLVETLGLVPWFGDGLPLTLATVNILATVALEMGMRTPDYRILLLHLQLMATEQKARLANIADYVTSHANSSAAAQGQLAPFMAPEQLERARVGYIEYAEDLEAIRLEDLKPSAPPDEAAPSAPREMQSAAVATWRKAQEGIAVYQLARLGFVAPFLVRVLVITKLLASPILPLLVLTPLLHIWLEFRRQRPSWKLPFLSKVAVPLWLLLVVVPSRLYLPLLDLGASWPYAVALGLAILVLLRFTASALREQSSTQRFSFDFSLRRTVRIVVMLTLALLADTTAGLMTAVTAFCMLAWLWVWIPPRSLIVRVLVENVLVALVLCQAAFGTIAASAMSANGLMALGDPSAIITAEGFWFAGAGHKMYSPLVAVYFCTCVLMAYAFQSFLLFRLQPARGVSLLGIYPKQRQGPLVLYPPWSAVTYATLLFTFFVLPALRFAQVGKFDRVEAADGDFTTAFVIALIVVFTTVVQGVRLVATPWRAALRSSLGRSVPDALMVVNTVCFAVIALMDTTPLGLVYWFMFAVLFVTRFSYYRLLRSGQTKPAASRLPGDVQTAAELVPAILDFMAMVGLFLAPALFQWESKLEIYPLGLLLVGSTLVLWPFSVPRLYVKGHALHLDPHAWLRLEAKRSKQLVKGWTDGQFHLFCYGPEWVRVHALAEGAQGEEGVLQVVYGVWVVQVLIFFVTLLTAAYSPAVSSTVSAALVVLLAWAVWSLREPYLGLGWALLFVLQTVGWAARHAGEWTWLDALQNAAFWATVHSLIVVAVVEWPGEESLEFIRRRQRDKAHAAAVKAAAAVEAGTAVPAAIASSFFSGDSHAPVDEIISKHSLYNTLFPGGFLPLRRTAFVQARLGAALATARELGYSARDSTVRDAILMVNGAVLLFGSLFAGYSVTGGVYQTVIFLVTTWYAFQFDLQGLALAAPVYYAVALSAMQALNGTMPALLAGLAFAAWVVKMSIKAVGAVKAKSGLNPLVPVSLVLWGGVSLALAHLGGTELQGTRLGDILLVLVVALGALFVLLAPWIALGLKAMELVLPLQLASTVALWVGATQSYDAYLVPAGVGLYAVSCAVAIRLGTDPWFNLFPSLERQGGETRWTMFQAKFVRNSLSYMIYSSLDFWAHLTLFAGLISLGQLTLWVLPVVAIWALALISDSYGDPVPWQQMPLHLLLIGLIAARAEPMWLLSLLHLPAAGAMLLWVVLQFVLLHPARGRCGRSSLAEHNALVDRLWWYDLRPYLALLVFEAAIGLLWLGGAFSWLVAAEELAGVAALVLLILVHSLVFMPLAARWCMASLVLRETATLCIFTTWLGLTLLAVDLGAWWWLWPTMLVFLLVVATVVRLQFVPLTFIIPTFPSENPSYADRLHAKAMLEASHHYQAVQYHQDRIRAAGKPTTAPVASSVEVETAVPDAVVAATTPPLERAVFTVAADSVLVSSGDTYSKNVKLTELATLILLSLLVWPTWGLLPAALLAVAIPLARFLPAQAFTDETRAAARGMPLAVVSREWQGEGLRVVLLYLAALAFLAEVLFLLKGIPDAVQAMVMVLAPCAVLLCMWVLNLVDALRPAGREVRKGGRTALPASIVLIPLAVMFFGTGLPVFLPHSPPWGTYVLPRVASTAVFLVSFFTNTIVAVKIGDSRMSLLVAASWLVSIMFLWAPTAALMEQVLRDSDLLGDLTTPPPATLFVFGAALLYWAIVPQLMRKVVAYSQWDILLAYVRSGAVVVAAFMMGPSTQWWFTVVVVVLFTVLEARRGHLPIVALNPVMMVIVSLLAKLPSDRSGGDEDYPFLHPLVGMLDVVCLLVASSMQRRNPGQAAQPKPTGNATADAKARDQRDLQLALSPILASKPLLFSQMAFYRQEVDEKEARARPTTEGALMTRYALFYWDIYLVDYFWLALWALAALLRSSLLPSRANLFDPELGLLTGALVTLVSVVLVVGRQVARQRPQLFLVIGPALLALPVARVWQVVASEQVNDYMPTAQRWAIAASLLQLVAYVWVAFAPRLLELLRKAGAQPKWLDWLRPVPSTAAWADSVEFEVMLAAAVWPCVALWAPQQGLGTALALWALDLLVFSWPSLHRGITQDITWFRIFGLIFISVSLLLGAGSAAQLEYPIAAAVLLIVGSVAGIATAALYLVWIRLADDPELGSFFDNAENMLKTGVVPDYTRPTQDEDVPSGDAAGGLLSATAAQAEVSQFLLEQEGPNVLLWRWKPVVAKFFRPDDLQGPLGFLAREDEAIFDVLNWTMQVENLTGPRFATRVLNLQLGDVITHFGGVEVRGSGDLARAITLARQRVGTEQAAYNYIQLLRPTGRPAPPPPHHLAVVDPPPGFQVVSLVAPAERGVELRNTLVHILKDTEPVVGKQRLSVRDDTGDALCPWTGLMPNDVIVTLANYEVLNSADWRAVSVSRPDKRGPVRLVVLREMPRELREKNFDVFDVSFQWRHGLREVFGESPWRSLQNLLGDNIFHPTWPIHVLKRDAAPFQMGDIVRQIGGTDIDGADMLAEVLDDMEFTAGEAKQVRAIILRPRSQSTWRRLPPLVDQFSLLPPLNYEVVFSQGPIGSLPQMLSVEEAVHLPMEVPGRGGGSNVQPLPPLVLRLVVRDDCEDENVEPGDLLVSLGHHSICNFQELFSCSTQLTDLTYLVLLRPVGVSKRRRPEGYHFVQLPAKLGMDVLNKLQRAWNQNMRNAAFYQTFQLGTSPLGQSFGARVQMLYPESCLAQMHVREGDILHQANLHDMEDIKEFMRKAQLRLQGTDARAASYLSVLRPTDDTIASETMANLNDPAKTLSLVGGSFVTYAATQAQKVLEKAKRQAEEEAAAAAQAQAAAVAEGAAAEEAAARAQEERRRAQEEKLALAEEKLAMAEERAVAELYKAELAEAQAQAAAERAAAEEQLALAAERLALVEEKERTEAEKEAEKEARRHAKEARRQAKEEARQAEILAREARRAAKEAAAVREAQEKAVAAAKRGKVAAITELFEQVPAAGKDTPRRDVPREFRVVVTDDAEVQDAATFTLQLPPQLIQSLGKDATDQLEDLLTVFTYTQLVDALAAVNRELSHHVVQSLDPESDSDVD